MDLRSAQPGSSNGQIDLSSPSQAVHNTNNSTNYFAGYPGSFQRGQFAPSGQNPGSSSSASTTPATSPRLKPLNLLGRTCDSEDNLLNSDLAHQLHQCLPIRYRLFSEWHLAYSSAQHGYSLNTLYHQFAALTTDLGGSAFDSFPPPSYSTSLPSTQSSLLSRNKKKAAGPCLLVLRESGSENLFGAYLSHPIRPSMQPYGSPDCFLWKDLTGQSTQSAALPDQTQFSQYSPSALHSVEVFKATGQNAFYILSEPDFLALGCSDGQFGLWMDSQLDQGQSCPVATFGYQPSSSLSQKNQFQIAGIEVWALLE